MSAPERRGKLRAYLEFIAAVLYYFVVRSYATSSQKLEDGEDVSIVPVTNEEARDMALNGRMQEDRSALMLLRYLSK